MTDQAGQRPATADAAPAVVPEQLRAEAARSLGALELGTSDEEGGRVGAGVARAPAPEVESFGKHVHQYLRDYIAVADQKAAFIFAISSALLVYLYQQKLHLRWIKPPAEWLAVDLFTFLGMTALLFGLGAAAVVVVPRVKSTHRGFVFFLSIAEFESASEYATSIARESAEGLTLALLKHDYDLARICKRKYQSLAVGIWASIIGVGISLLVLLFRGTT